MNLRNKNGIAAILVIIIIVVAVGAGGAAALGVRAVVTGESYLAPFEELGWITLDDNDDNDDTEEVSSDGVVEKNSELTHYEISLDCAKLIEAGISIYQEAQASLYSYTTTDDDYDLSDYEDIFDSIEITLNIYADGNNITESVGYFSYGDALEELYNYFAENEPESVEDYDTYEDFLEDMYDEMENEGFSEDAFLEAYEDMLDEYGIEYDEDELEDLIYLDIDKDNGILEFTVTFTDEMNESIAEVFETYEEEIIEVAEEYLDIEFDSDNYLEEIIKIAVAAMNSFEDGMLSLKIDNKKVDLSDYDIDLMSLINSYSSGLSLLDTSALTAAEVKTLNGVYENYEGDSVLGSNVKSLLSDLTSNAKVYESDGDKIPTVIFVDKNSDTLEATGGSWAEDDVDDYLEEISEISTSLASTHSYSVSITDYNSSGYISEITIEY